MMRCLAILLLAAVTVSATAQELRNLPPAPRDFAWQWPLTVTPGEDLVRLTLTPEVYARLWRDDVSDLMVFNGNDEAVPMAPLELLRERPATASVPTSTLVEAPAFRIPASTVRNIGDRVRLVVAQRSDGRLERLDAEVGPEPAPPAPSGEWLLDLSALRAPVRGLELELDPDAAPLVAQVDVFGSRDLSGWERVSRTQAVVALDEGGLRLERRRIEFPDTTLPYLRLQRSDSNEPLPLARVQVLRGSLGGGEETVLEQTEPPGHAEPMPGWFRYDDNGPFPTERLVVELADRNAAATVIVESRLRPELPWRERARGAVFRITGKHGEIESSPLDVGLVRDREWRLRTEPVQTRPPVLRLLYRPDRFAFLTQGEPPFRLVAGSARSQRSNAPLQAVFVQMQQAHGGPWQWSEARLGRAAELAGGAALAPRPDASGSPTPWQWLLWGLLLAAAFSVVTMVLRLLRQSGA